MFLEELLITFLPIFYFVCVCVLMVSVQIIWKTDPSETENLLYKKTADSVLLSLLMRTNGKCNISHAPWHRLKGYSAFIQNPIFLKDNNFSVMIFTIIKTDNTIILLSHVHDIQEIAY